MQQSEKNEMSPEHHMYTEQQPLNVLLIEDDDAMRKMLAEVFRREGWKVTECENVLRWLKFCVNETKGNSAESQDIYDVVVSDIRMPDMSGLDVLRMLKDIHCAEACPPTILITAFGDEESHQRAKQLGATQILNKPFDTKTLITCVRQAALL